MTPEDDWLNGNYETGSRNYEINRVKEITESHILLVKDNDENYFKKNKIKCLNRFGSVFFFFFFSGVNTSEIFKIVLSNTQY